MLSEILPVNLSIFSPGFHEDLYKYATLNGR
jgi:hypothetical protein